MPAELTEQPVHPEGSLYQLASGLGQLMQLREDEDLAPEEREVIDQQIKAYIAAEVRKVDGIRAYIRNCEAQLQAAKNEILRITQYQRAWESRYERVKDFTLAVLREFVQPDSKGRVKLEGATGSLAIQANGGKLALEITRPELVPDEYCRMVGWVDASLWAQFKGWMTNGSNAEKFKLERVPNNDMIRAALESDCETCGGLGRIAVHTEEDLEPSLCGACGGDGKTKVPGARFAPRGERLVVK